MDDMIENLENMEEHFFEGEEDDLPDIGEMYVTYDDDGVQVFSPFPLYSNESKELDNNNMLIKDVLEIMNQGLILVNLARNGFMS